MPGYETIEIFHSTSSEDDILRSLRLLHLYVGVFIAPAILFFAFTGILQTFSLHEVSKDGSYTPPRWVLELAQLHKKQTVQVQERKPQPGPGSGAGKGDGPKKDVGPQQGPPAPKHNPLPMKIFFLLVGVGLIVSTFTGLYMSYKISRKKGLLAVIFVGGIVVPMLLLVV